MCQKKKRAGSLSYDGIPHSVGRCRLTLSNPRLKPPGTKRLKLKCDIVLSSFAFKFNLRRYNSANGDVVAAIAEAGAYTRSEFSST